MRNETYEETIEYLLSTYDYEYNAESKVSIDFPSLNDRPSQIVVPTPVYEGKPLDTSYLIKRGIHPKIIELQGVFNAGNAIGIPWRNSRGDVLNIKYRLKQGKLFWYERCATPIRNMVYGLDTVIQRGITEVVICEAEIDAMTWQSAGVYAIAVGGVSFNRTQVDKIISSGVEKVTLGGDNDKAGMRFNERVSDMLSKYVDLYDLDYGDFGSKKDANDVGPNRLANIKKIRRMITPDIPI